MLFVPGTAMASPTQTHMHNGGITESSNNLFWPGWRAEGWCVGQGLAFSLTCPCGPTRLEFKLWEWREPPPPFLHGWRWNIEIAVCFFCFFSLFPASCDIPTLWHLSANQSDGQLTRREQRRGRQRRFVLVGLVVKEVERHLRVLRETVLQWSNILHFEYSGQIVRRKCCQTPFMCRSYCQTCLLLQSEQSSWFISFCSFV